MLYATSISGKDIRLTDERWSHIVEGHPEMAGFRHDVLSVIASPDFIVQGGYDEMLAVARSRSGKMLVVVYKENDTDGFILTAYLTSKIEKLIKRKMIWRK